MFPVSCTCAVPFGTVGCFRVPGGTGNWLPACLHFIYIDIYIQLDMINA